MTANPLYFMLLDAISTAPFKHPFIDWEWMPSAAACWQRGVDVYVDNTCYLSVPHLQHNYSPLWLRASFLPTDPYWVNVLGLGHACLYLGILACLPPPRSLRDLSFTLLISISGFAFFAVERAHADLLMLALIVAGVALWCGMLARRVAGYVVFTIAGLLKFYPMVLLALVLRERGRAFFLIVLVLGAVVVCFVLLYFSEFQLALGNVPKASYFANMIGATILPFGFSSLLTEIVSKTITVDGALRMALTLVLPAFLMIVLLGVSVWRAWRLVEPGGMRPALAAMASWEANLLIAGAVLICGCFFAGTSIGYRGVMLILVMPGLLRLTDMLSHPLAIWNMRVTYYAVLAVAWVKLIQFCTNLVTVSGSIWRAAQWAVNELAWWWIVGTFLGVVAVFILESPFLSQFRGRRSNA